MDLSESIDEYKTHSGGKFSALFHPLQQGWHFRMMETAQYFGSWTKCLSRSIGAVIVRDKTILSTGYNGPSRGVPECHTPERRDQIVRSFYNTPSDRHLAERLHTEWGTKCPRQILGFKSGEGLHLCIAGHAEANAVANAAREGVRITGAAMYCYCGVPCQECAKMIIGGGLAQVFHLETLRDYDLNSRWMLKSAGVSLIPIREEDIEKNRLLRSEV